MKKLNESFKREKTEKDDDDSESAQVHVIAVNNSKELNELLLTNSSIDIGVEFPDDLKDAKTLKHLKYKIRPKSYPWHEWDDGVDSTTTRKTLMKGPKNVYDDEGGLHGSSSLLFIQNEIDRQFIMLNAPDKEIPFVKMKVGPWMNFR